MPNAGLWLNNLLSLSDFFLHINYKEIIINFSFIYYLTVFFLLTRVLVYFGLTLINLINAKHTTLFKKSTSRFYLGVMLKFYNNGSFKKNFLKLVTVNCL